MASYKISDLYATGMAIFAMFFGAGNIIFPLAMGRQVLDQTPYAILGLLLTAVLVPFSGLLAMFLYEGKVRTFFGRIGESRGLLLAFFIIALLGPFGSTPRCIALSFSTLHLTFPGLSPLLFNSGACICLFFFAFKKQRLLGLLGYVLTPLLLSLLAFIVFKGLWSAEPMSISPQQVNALAALWTGLTEGYMTMDLLAAFFFAPVIIALINTKTTETTDAKTRFMFVVKASAIGALLLSIVYIGFSLLAAFHAEDLQGIPSENLLGMIALKILGPHAGLIVSLTVVLACLTTAIALIAAFAAFVHQELLGSKSHYQAVLAFSILATFCVACFEFQGISRFLGPVLEVCYPALIILTAYNLGERIYQMRSIPQIVETKQGDSTDFII